MSSLLPRTNALTIRCVRCHRIRVAPFWLVERRAVQPVYDSAVICPNCLGVLQARTLTERHHDCKDIFYERPPVWASTEGE